MQHPFDQEALDAAYDVFEESGTAPEFLALEPVFQAAWDSMFARGQMFSDFKRTFYFNNLENT